MAIDAAWQDRRVLVTGHTGFKGSWLSLWLADLGAEVHGLALDPPTQPNLFTAAQVGGTLARDNRADIRDFTAVQDVFRATEPELVLHLAAQALVSDGYDSPLDTYAVNVLGTAHVLEAVRHCDSVRAVLVITSDKCYENREWLHPYRETDRLGGHDPYSASKAGAELVSASYRNAFFDGDTSLLLATARSGNVIGGGDWSEDRLVPDLIRALEKGQPLKIRSPDATRPWQHVLESLSGYLLLGQQLLAGNRACAGAWNFGPEPDGNCTVAEVLGNLARYWKALRWHVTDLPQPHEAKLLYLDSARARSLLHWHPVWNIDATLARTAEWYRAWQEGGAISSRRQLAEYVAAANQVNLAWAGT